MLITRSIERIAHQAESAGVEIIVHDVEESPPLFVDPSRTVQVFANLLGNAIKYSSRGGVVDICMRRAGGDVEIAVQDHGIGILPEDLSRIFERFYKADRARQSTGSGLGLAIAKHIVTAQGGEITAESEYEEGSTFTVRLPTSDRSAPA